MEARLGSTGNNLKVPLPILILLFFALTIATALGGDNEAEYLATKRMMQELQNDIPQVGIWDKPVLDFFRDRLVITKSIPVDCTQPGRDEVVHTESVTLFFSELASRISLVTADTKIPGFRELTTLHLSFEDPIEARMFDLAAEALNLPYETSDYDMNVRIRQISKFQTSGLQELKIRSGKTTELCSGEILRFIPGSHEMLVRLNPRDYISYTRALSKYIENFKISGENNE